VLRGALPIEAGAERGRDWVELVEVLADELAPVVVGAEGRRRGDCCGERVLSRHAPNKS
jgi:hypothetical protein